MTAVINVLPRTGDPVWLLQMNNMAQMFVVYAAIEYAVVNYLTRVEARVQAALKANGEKMADTSVMHRLADATKRANGRHSQTVVAGNSSNTATADVEAGNSSTTATADVDAPLEQGEVTIAVVKKRGSVFRRHPAAFHYDAADEMGWMGRLLTKGGTTNKMLLYDQDLDVFSRVFFPVAQHGQSGRLGRATAGHHGLPGLHVTASGRLPHP